MDHLLKSNRIFVEKFCKGGRQGGGRLGKGGRGQGTRDRGPGTGEPG